jgi:hypothetical protein
MVNPAEANARDLELEMVWLALILDARFDHYFHLAGGHPDPKEIPPPDLTDAESQFAEVARSVARDGAERVALALALAPCIRPRLLDVFHTRNATFGRRFTEFGGTRNGSDGDFWPTPETVAFVLGGDDLMTRFRVESMFGAAHPFALRNVLKAVPSHAGEPVMRSAMRIPADTLSRISLGEACEMSCGPGFPARRIDTALDWDDLVLHPSTRAQVMEIEAWTRHEHTLLQKWGMSRHVRPGHRALFHGPPGTGKTLTACLLGKATGRDVYRIDLSLVVSKYIGETEKNLAAVFDAAQSRAWILLFDEADALFGKRSETKDAHDRYANQEIAFLLQRVETFDGIAILASNMRDNIDNAFARRFESVIHFPMPRAGERAEIWRRGMPKCAPLAADVDIDDIAREHTLAGAAIMNAIRFASLASINDGRPIHHYDLLNAIQREYAKEGRV